MTPESYEYVCEECGRVFKEKEAYHSIRAIYDSDGCKFSTEMPVPCCPECYIDKCSCKEVKSGGAPHNA